MEKETKNIMITEQEHKRLKELKEIFKVGTMSGVFEPALAYVATHREIEVKTPVRNGSIRWRRANFSIKPEILALIERYSLVNFRDFTNTLRFLINASYENITNNKK